VVLSIRLIEAKSCFSGKIALRRSQFCGMALRGAAPPEFKKHAGAHSTVEHPSPERNPGHGRMSVKKKFNMKRELK
jgi:hypothetical protein